MFIDLKRFLVGIAPLQVFLPNFYGAYFIMSIIIYVLSFIRKWILWVCGIFTASLRKSLCPLFGVLRNIFYFEKEFYLFDVVKFIYFNFIICTLLLSVHFVLCSRSPFLEIKNIFSCTSFWMLYSFIIFIYLFGSLGIDFRVWREVGDLI